MLYWYVTETSSYTINSVNYETDEVFVDNVLLIWNRFNDITTHACSRVWVDNNVLVSWELLRIFQRRILYIVKHDCCC